MREFLLALILLFVSHIFAERIFPCPNNAKPKLTNLGKPIQCLPGQDNEQVCGRGFVCFFSGFNYQCCPSMQSDEEKDAEVECPLGSLTVLDSAGAIQACDASGSCPQDNMHCTKVGKKSICCEPLTPRSFEIKKDKVVQQGAKIHNLKESSKFDSKPNKIKDEVAELECPAQYLTVLGDDGLPLLCLNSHDCPQENMECYTTSRYGICCENFASINGHKNPLKYLPQSNNVHSEHGVEQAPAPQKPKPVVKEEKPSFVNGNLDSDYDYSEIKVASPSTKPTEAPEPTKRPKNRSRNLALAAQLTQPDTKTIEEPIVEFKPHPGGGYAVKKIENKRKRPAEARLLAQQYLLEQIKNGWPYDEKFYRTSNDS